MARGEPGVVEAGGLKEVGIAGFDERVRTLAEAVEDPASSGMGHVEGDAPGSRGAGEPVDGEFGILARAEVGAAAPQVAPPRRLDPDHVRAEIGEHASAEEAALVANVEDAEAFEEPFHDREPSRSASAASTAPRSRGPRRARRLAVRASTRGLARCGNGDAKVGPGADQAERHRETALVHA